MSVAAPTPSAAARNDVVDVSSRESDRLQQRDHGGDPAVVAGSRPCGCACIDVDADVPALGHEPLVALGDTHDVYRLRPPVHAPVFTPGAACKLAAGPHVGRLGA